MFGRHLSVLHKTWVPCPCWNAEIWACHSLLIFMLQLGQISNLDFSYRKPQMCLISAPMMSWVRVWVDLILFTTQFFDKVLLDTWKLRECETKEILTRIWLISESVSKQSSQLKLKLNSICELGFLVLELVVGSTKSQLNYEYLDANIICESSIINGKVDKQWFRTNFWLKWKYFLKFSHL